MAKFGLRPHPRSKAGVALNAQGVCMSPELARILSLPRRPFQGQADDLTPIYSKGVDKCGVANCRICVFGPPTLRPIQSQMLWEASRREGLYAMAGVGSGKTLPSLLFHDAMNAQRTVLLIKPNLRTQLFGVDIPAYGRHFYLPPVHLAANTKSFEENAVYVVCYSELSDVGKGHWLERISPDLVVADEAHVFRNKGSARTKRYLRFADEHHECRFVEMSGSMIKRSIRDGYLAELALRKDSPLPNGRTLFEWSCAIDDHVEKPIAPGKLMLFCNPGEGHREGFRRRLVESEGVVATQKGSIDTALEITQRDLVIPPKVSAALGELDALWRWEGEEIADALHYARLAKQLACGFFYRWVWPKGQRDDEWLLARNAWHKEVRQYLKYHSEPGMDSLLQLANAASAGRWRSETWEAWAKVKHRDEPPTEAVWIDDQFLVRDAGKWGVECVDEGEGAIIWYDHIAVGKVLERHWPVFWPGDKDAARLDRVTPAEYPIIVVSRLAYSQGKNLQAYSRNLVVTTPANSTDWEQMIGRTHRPGQMADEVKASWYGHTEDLEKAFLQAVKNAEYLQATTGEPQKLLYANMVGLDG